MSARKTIHTDEINAAIERIAQEIADAHPTKERLVLAGIANGGLPLCSQLAEALGEKLGSSVPQAVIDISFHRDDIGEHPITKVVQGTQMADDPADTTLILVDDVLFSGRTVRAAIAEVLTIGRPFQIELAVLVDRGNRRLPIAANYVGFVEETDPDETVAVTLGTKESRIEILTD